uniref:Uncharacterized protein n=1 Tax=Rhizophora mucronata TaxID=61149 RepID=A0A2P2Q8X0_RHIMU
MFAKPPPIV